MISGVDILFCQNAVGMDKTCYGKTVFEFLIFNTVSSDKNYARFRETMGLTSGLETFTLVSSTISSVSRLAHGGSGCPMSSP